MHAIDKHEKKIIIMKKINERGAKKLFGCFLFLNRSLRWFLVVPPKDGFTPNLTFEQGRS